MTSDFDFDFDFGSDENKETVPRLKTKFNLRTAADNLKDIVPANGESVRLISPAGGASSCAVVAAIAEQTKIESATITTLRAGKKEALALENLGIERVRIVCGGIALENARKYDYAKILNDISNRNGWTISYNRNHSKLILLKTDAGKIVIETSSNFNENPQIEQFCITNDELLFNWYEKELTKLGVIGEWKEKRR